MVIKARLSRGTAVLSHGKVLVCILLVNGRRKTHLGMFSAFGVTPILNDSSGGGGRILLLLCQESITIWKGCDYLWGSWMVCPGLTS
jgi:hypothetical protein